MSNRGDLAVGPARTVFRCIRTKLPGASLPAPSTRSYSLAVIIACERCKTRFNVPDDKLGAGPVRMRCSKCDHTFTASAATAQPGPPVVVATSSLPPTATQSMTPVAPRAMTPGPGASPFAGLGPGRATEPFAAIAPPTAAPFSASPFAGGPFAPPRATPGPSAPGATGLFGAAPMPVTGVSGPFGMGSAPTRPAPDPFADLAAPTAQNPFAALAVTPPKPAVDPFAALAPKPTAPDPFGALAPPPKAGPDPFAAFGPSAAAVAADPFSKGPAPAVPFAPKPPFGDLFGPSPAAPSPAAPSPFAAAPSPFAAAPSPSPFGGSPSPGAAPSPFGPMATPDPFAVAPPPPPTRRAADPFASADPFADPPAGGPPGLPARDPFEDDDTGGGSGMGVDDDARAALFGIRAPPPWAPPTDPVSAQSSGLELATPTVALAPAAVAPPRGPSRLITGLAAAFQVVLLVGFTVVAVVVGRGGSLPGLLVGDLPRALALATVPDNGLVIDDVVVARRLTGSGLAVLVISGVVHHRGSTALPAVVVEAIVGDATARGQAWTAVTPVAIEAARAPEDLAVLQAMRSSSPTVSPGDRAPFVIVMAAPEGVARPGLSARAAN